MTETSSQGSSRASSMLKGNRQAGNSAQQNLFILLRACSADHYARALVAVGIVVELLQLLAFALNPNVSGHRTTWSIFYAFQVPFWDSDFATGVTFDKFIPMLWVVLAPLWIVLVLFAAGMFFPHYIASDVLARGASYAVHFFVAPFYVPTLQMLLSVLSCTTGNPKQLWRFPETACDAPLRATHYPIAVASLVCLIALASLQKSCNYNPKRTVADDPTSMGHGTLELLSVVYKSGVCIGFHLLLARGMASYYCFLVGMGALLLSLLYCLVLPYYSRAMNQLYAVAYAIVAYAAFVVFIDYRQNTFSYVQNGGFYATLALGAPVVAFLANSLAQVRYSRPTDRLLQAATTAAFVPPGANPFARAAMAGDPDLLPFPRHLPASDYVFSPIRSVESDIVDELLRSEQSTSAATEDLSQRMARFISLPQVVSPTLESILLATDAEVATRYLESWMLLTESVPTPHMLSFACRIYAKAIMKFPGSPIVVVHFVRFLLERVPSLARMNLGAQLMEATQASMFCAVTDSYQIYLLGGQIKAALGVRDKSNSSLFRQARRAHKRVLIENASIWQGIVEQEHPDYVALCFYSNALSDGRHACLANYMNLLRVMPEDDSVLRNFGQFAETVCYNPVSAKMCFDEAACIGAARREKLQGQAAATAAAKGSDKRSAISATTKGSKSGSATHQLLAHVSASITTQLATLEENLSTSFLYKSTAVTLLILIGIVVCMAVVTVLLNTTRQKSYNRIADVGTMRTFALRSLKDLAEVGYLLSPAGAGAAGAGKMQHTLQQLRINVQGVESMANSWMFGKSMFDDPKIVFAVSQPLNVMKMTGGGYEPTNAWDLIQGFCKAMLEALQAVESGQVATSDAFFALKPVEFLHSNEYVWMSVFSRVLQELTNGESRVTEQHMAIVVTVGSLCIATCVLVAFLILYNFRKAASTKVKTLALFFTISKDALRGLLRDAKAALQTYVNGGATADRSDLDPVLLAGGITGAAAASSGGGGDGGFDDDSKRRASQTQNSKLLAHLIGAGKLVVEGGSTSIGRDNPPFATTTPAAAAAATADSNQPFANATADEPTTNVPPAGGPQPPAARRKISISLTAASAAVSSSKPPARRVTKLERSFQAKHVLDSDEEDQQEQNDLAHDNDEAHAEEPGSASDRKVALSAAEAVAALSKIETRTVVMVAVSVVLIVAAFVLSLAVTEAIVKQLQEVNAFLVAFNIVDTTQREFVKHLSDSFRVVLTGSAEEAAAYVRSSEKAQRDIEDLLLKMPTLCDANVLARVVTDAKRLLTICSISAALALGNAKAVAFAPSLASPSWSPVPRTQALLARYRKHIPDVSSRWIVYGKADVDMALHDAERQALAEQVVFDRFAYADLLEFQDSMRELTNSILGNSTLLMRGLHDTTTASFLAVGVLWVLAIAGIAAASSAFTRLHFGLRKATFVTLAVACVACASAFLVTVQVQDLQTKHVLATSAFEDTTSPIQHALLYTHSSLCYLYGSGDQQFLHEYLYEADPLRLVLREGFVSKAPVGAMPAQITNLRSYFAARSYFLNFATISSVLAMQAYGSPLLNGSGRINHVTWNLPAEDTTNRHLLQHPNDVHKLYANTTGDAARSGPEKLALARRMAASHMWRFWYDEMASTNLLLADGVASTRAAAKADANAAFLLWINVVRYASFICAGLGLAIVLYVGLEKLDEFSATEDERQMFDALYRPIAIRAIATVLLLGCTLLALLVMAVLNEKDNEEVATLISRSSGLSMFAYRAESLVVELSLLDFKLSSQVDIQRQLLRLLEVEGSLLEQVLFASSVSEILRKSYNAFLFGAEGDFSTRANVTAIMEAGCYAPDNHVDGNQQPLVLQYVKFMGVVREIATFSHADMAMSIRSGEPMHPRLRELAASTAPEAFAILRTSLHLYDEHLNHEAVTHQKEELVYIAILLAIAAVIALVACFYVLWPAVTLLTQRELGMKLLLMSLPEDVQAASPGIRDYFNVQDSEAARMKKQLVQSEKLLQNILPPVVSRRLKNGERIIADTHPNVTVVFAALIGFDEYSKAMEARQIVHFLNGLIVTFDHIVDLLDLEKIKTIGDVYFLCGGLTTKTEADHPLRCMECALLFFDAVHDNNVRKNTPNLTLRAGINTDPAVAGVIGSKKVAYDLWGDSVNTSSRMQSTGIGGKIQVSDKTYRLIKEYYSFTDRSVSAKGKGELKTHMYLARLKPTPYSSINWKKSR